MSQQYPYFTEEHELFRTSIKRFCRERIAPQAQKWEEAHAFPKGLFKEAAELGLFGIRADAEWGGAGMDWWASAAAYDALKYTDFPSLNIGYMVQADLTIPALCKFGTPEQKKEFLVPAITAERIAALAISEPDAGSDVANISTRAAIDGGDFVISGQKLWITNGTIADFLVLAVRTDEDPKHGLSLVLFPTDTKGYSVGKRLSKIGHVASDTGHLFFDGCRIPRRYLLGEQDRGFYYILENFLDERLAVALLVLSFLDRSMELATAYARERRAFRKPLMDNQVWRHRFAEHGARIEAARWLTYRAVDLMSRGEPAVREVTMAKLVTTELSNQVTYDCQQIFGGYGYTTEYPMGRIWRDMRLYTIGAGTSEIMKEILAKQAKW